MTLDDRIALAVQDAAFLARFWARVSKSDGCWTWNGARDRRGYGTLPLPRLKGLPNATARASRVAWRVARGSAPEDLFVCHTCDNPSCVRDAHLFVGTHTDNMRDMARKGRKSVRLGEKNPISRLTEDDIRAIRAAVLRETQTAVAARYGICTSTLSAIVFRRAWRHVV